MNTSAHNEERPMEFCPTSQILRSFHNGALLTEVSRGVDDHLNSCSSCAEKVKKLDLPSLIGYEIEEELGRGGMGIVYRAREFNPNRTVAIKMIKSDKLRATEELVRFRTEAAAVAGLQHQNIVAV